MVAGPVECVARTGDFCGEGAVWHPGYGALYWTDINRCLIHRFRKNDGYVTTWSFDQPVTALALTEDDERLVVVLGGKVLLWAPCNNARELLHELEAWPAIRYNDARVDPGGTLWLGTMQNNIVSGGEEIEVTQSVGELLSFRAKNGTNVWDQHFMIPNTVVWSPQGKTMYVGDTLRNTLFAYDYDAAAQSIGRKRIFCKNFLRGLPDGSCVDAQGFVWNCRFGGACVVRLAPDGSVDHVLEMPVANPTTCVFGGDRLADLYITSASKGAYTPGGFEGGLFRVRVAVGGLEPTRFSLG